jgi:hydrogenase-4 component B
MALQALLRSAVLASTSVRIVFALCGAALALTAALAVTCFVKTYAMNFLGIRRGTWKLRGGVQEMSKFPLAYLAVICLLLGILPTYVLPILNQSVESLAGTSVTTALVQPFFTATPENAQLPAAFLQDFHNLGAQTGRGLIPGRGLVVLLRGGEANPVVFAMSPSYSIIALVVLFAAAWFGVRRLTRHRILSRRPVWAGGIPRLLPLFTYTGTGFSNPVRVVFQAIFRPNIIEDTRQTVAVHFRTAIHRQREETHVVDRLLLKPVGTAVQRVAAFLAGMHHGKLNAYITYVLAFLLLMLFIYRGA